MSHGVDDRPGRHSHDTCPALPGVEGVGDAVLVGTAADDDGPDGDAVDVDGLDADGAEQAASSSATEAHTAAVVRRMRPV
jgi:hypothetical protein